MPPRENAWAKGRRLLAEGRLRIRQVNGSHVEATCRGDSSAVYRVRHVPGAGWACTCDARTRCSHVIAAQLVTVVDDRRGCRMTYTTTPARWCWGASRSPHVDPSATVRPHTGDAVLCDSCWSRWLAEQGPSDV